MLFTLYINSTSYCNDHSVSNLNQTQIKHFKVTAVKVINENNSTK